MISDRAHETFERYWIDTTDHAPPARRVCRDREHFIEMWAERFAAWSCEHTDTSIEFRWWLAAGHVLFAELFEAVEGVVT